MIKLSDVSVSKLYSKILNIQKNQRLSEDINDCINVLTIFRENAINNYEDLKNMLYKFENTFLYNYIKSDLNAVEKRINVANMKGVEPEIYAGDWYCGVNISESILKVTDNNTNCSVLPFTSPLVCTNMKKRILSNYSIADAKYMLGHLQSDLRNEFKFVTGCYSKEDLIRLKNLIKFYEMQVQRQYEGFEERSYPVNLFNYDDLYKAILVELQLDDIVEYLFDNGESFIWGDFSDKDKLRLLNATCQSKHYAKNNLIDLISNYTTFSELETGAVKSRALDRFIVK